MRPALLTALVVASLGISFAAGAYFAPAIFHSGYFGLSSVPSATASSPDATVAGGPVSGGSTQPTANSKAVPNDPATIFKETNPYRLYKDLTAYTETISAADMPKVFAAAHAAKAPAFGSRSEALSILAGDGWRLTPRPPPPRRPVTRRILFRSASFPRLARSIQRWP